MFAVVLRLISPTILMLGLVCLPLQHPIQADENKVHSGRAMGTSYTLKYSERGLTMAEEDLARAVSEELERIESIFSLYRTESEISRLNAAPAGDWIQVSEDLYVVAKCGFDLYFKTGGAFDPTVRPLVELWQGDRLSGAWKPPSPAAIAAQLKMVGASRLDFRPEPLSIRKDAEHLQLDLNALVEGWAIARVLELLERRGCTRALFELGGEYGSIGSNSESESWTLGIEDPQAPTQVYATLGLQDGALCTSGVYRQARTYAGKQYAHLIDPRTGCPVEHACLSVSVLHADAMVADGWATALMVLGPHAGMKLANQHGLVASFACGSANGTVPKFSQLAEGKFTLAPGTQSRGPAWSLILGILVISSTVAVVWFACRKWNVFSSVVGSHCPWRSN